MKRFFYVFFLLGLPLSPAFAGEALDTCRSLLGLYKYFLPLHSISENAKPIALRSAVDGFNKKKEISLVDLGGSQIVSAVAHLNENAFDPQAHRNLIAAVRPHLQLRSFALREAIADEPPALIVPVLPLSRTAEHASDYFYELIAKLEGWGVKTYFDTASFLDTSTTRAWFERTKATLAFSPPFMQWFESHLNPSTVHELVHLAFAFQRQADHAGDISFEPLPPIFSIRVSNELLPEAHKWLDTYATPDSPTHSTDEVDAHLASGLVSLDMAESLKEIADRTTLESLVFETLIALRKARNILEFDRELFDHALKTLRQNRGGVVARQNGLLDRSYHSRRFAIAFSKQQAHFRVKMPNGAGDTRHDRELREALIKFFEIQTKHYAKLSKMASKYLQRADVLLDEIRLNPK